MTEPMRPMYRALCLWLLTVLMMLPIMAVAQSDQPASTPDPLAGLPIQVLDQQEVDLGDHKITLNRIAPPNLPTPVPTPTPAPQQAPTPGGAPAQEKLLKVVSLSVDTQNQLYTEVRDYQGAKPELHAHLNLDFRLFGSVPQLETSDSFYMYILAMDFDTADAEANVNADPPDPTASLPDHASYVITAGNAADYPDALGGLDALCAYFDANRVQLIADYRKRRDDAELAKNQPPTPTPKPADTVINYWPSKNSVYLNQAH